ncbi:L-histidine N(alpha)-methyltransferase [Crocinitomix algicola]|uniref:L-histidine N(alpha)-methyltransferase n=1 Tax=Crocinitomix algicola TaxID=1740263 RepID=UPI00082B75D1|nr:L-histidine N(alpha)-methyltransferase [Crocinitomix algicola]
MSTFANHVKEGLSKKQKQLSSMYFYDDNGSRIFQEIMAMPEYYLTNSEMEIFESQSQLIYKSLGFTEEFSILELGAGDGAKTEILLRQFLKNSNKFTYRPIDISQEANDILQEKMSQNLPYLKINPATGDYFEVLKKIKKEKKPVLLLFIGSNIGNYSKIALHSLLELLQETMKVGDQILVGVDLKKHPKTILNAYDDPHGITKRFNLNLLKRINSELKGNFELENFDFYVSYSPETGEVRSYLVSLIDQVVKIEGLNQLYTFEAGECIWTELSKKYDMEELNELFSKHGFKLKAQFKDKKSYFVDALFERL